MGASLCGILIQRVLDTQLHMHLERQDADHVAEKIRQSIEYIKDFPEETRVVIRECYGAAVQAGFVLCSGVLAAATLFVLFWKEKRLDR